MWFLLNNKYAAISKHNVHTQEYNSFLLQVSSVEADKHVRQLALSIAFIRVKVIFNLSVFQSVFKREK